MTISTSSTTNQTYVALDFGQLPKVLETLRLMANPERLKILCVLGERELNVGEIEKLTGIHQPTLSQQLGFLRKAGVVSTHKTGKFVYYQLVDKNILALITTLHQLYCQA